MHIPGTLLFPQLSPSARSLAANLVFSAPPFTAQGNTIKDLSGNLIDITAQATGVTRQCDSRLGIGVNTVRSTNKFFRSATNVEILKWTGAWTVSAWILPTTISPGNDGYFFTYRKNGNHYVFNLLMENTTGRAKAFFHTSDAVFSTTTGTSACSTTKPTFVTAVYIPSTSVKLYVNGVLETTTTSSIPTALPTYTDVAINIGGPGDMSSSGFNFNGAIWHPCAWTRDLTAGEIWKLYEDPWRLWRHRVPEKRVPIPPPPTILSMCGGMQNLTGGMVA